MLVHAFETFGGYYLYDANTSSILNVSNGIFRAFKSGSFKGLSDEDRSILNHLKKSGFLLDSLISKIEHPFAKQLPSLLDRRVEGLTLQVTQQCNLRCKYCVYSGAYDTRTHSNKSMSIETAKKCMDFLIQHSTDLESVNISFYGGEPLLEFELIKETIEYVRSISEGKKITLGMTTNGTMFTDTILEYLQASNFDILLSLDGSKDIHDRNRVFASNGKGTFDYIMDAISHIKGKFPKLYKKISFNAVIDPKLGESCSNMSFITGNDFDSIDITGNLIGDVYRKKQTVMSEAFLINYEEEYFKHLMSKLGLVSREKTSKLVYFKFQNILTNLFLRRSKSIEIASSNHPSGPCIPGAKKLFVDVNGVFFPCENASEKSQTMVIGNIDKGFDVEAAQRILNVGQISEEKCKSCWAFRLCTQCAIHADEGTHLSKKQRLSRCNDDKYGFEQDLKDYCSLIELGFDFQDDINKEREIGGRNAK